MKLISHRGNVSGPNKDLENKTDYINNAIDQGFDVEIDLRINNGCLFLGHDYPQYEIDFNWLKERKDKLWIHCKDFKSLSLLSSTDFTFFFHLKEDYTIISNGLIWVDNLNNYNNKCVIPLITKDQIQTPLKNSVFGICSDYISLFKNENIME